MSNETTKNNQPFSYENWKAYDSGAELNYTIEYPLFTDAHIIGGVTDTYGPYQLINALNVRGIYPTRPSIVLRVDSYLAHDPPSMKKTDVSRYHGGLLSDEIAALVSLCLGIRLKAGGESRVFGWNEDPKGLPMSWGHSGDPVLPSLKQKLVLPRALKEHNLDRAAPLSKLHLLPPAGAITLGSV